MEESMKVSLDWSQALAWRLQQHLLEPVGIAAVAEVVRRLGAVPAQSDAASELAVRVRRVQSYRGEVAHALAEGQIIKTYAFRGATHLLTPEEGGKYLVLRAASRMWELPSWQSFYNLTPADWPRLRAAVREALANGPLTRAELSTVVTAQPAFRHLGAAFMNKSDTFLKPLMWQGDMSFGTSRDGLATFQRLDHNPRWTGLPDLEAAGRQAVMAYFQSYGPATFEHVHYWLGGGLGAGRKRIQSWITALGPRLVPIDIAGNSAYILHEDRDALIATPPSTAMRLLPGYDQWVLGPGTADVHIVPPARRPLVSRQANLVIVGGVVSGTWSLADELVVVAWFAEAGPPDREALAEEVARLAMILERPLESTIHVI